MLCCPESFVFVAERILSLHGPWRCPWSGRAWLCAVAPCRLLWRCWACRSRPVVAIQLLVQDPAAALPVSVGFCEAG